MKSLRTFYEDGINMNKVFKVVWSKVRNCYVVVSEIAKNTVSGVGKRNRIGKVSFAATLAASVLTGGFFMPNEVLAAVSALVPSEAVYYIAIGNAKTNVNPFGSNNDIVYDWASGQRYVEVVDGGKTYKYIYTSVSVGGSTKYYWIREGFGVKAMTERYHPEAANVKLDLYKIPGTNATYDNVAMSGEHSMVVSDVETAINKTKLDSVQYIQYAALSNSDGTGVPITYSYYLKRGEQYVDVGGGNGTNLKNNFYVFKDGEFNTLTGKYKFKGKDVEYDNVYNVGGEVGVFLTTSVNGVYDSNKTSNQLPANADVYGGTVYGLNNEVLLSGYNNTTKKWSTVWAAEITDPHATVESMTLGEFNEIMHHLHEEDVKLANEGIVKTKITSGVDTHITENNTISSGGSINLVNKAGNQVPGFTMQSLGGTGGNYDDTYIRVKDSDGGYFDLNTGTKVVANDGVKYTDGDSLTSLTVNGNRYTISGGNGSNSDTTEIAGYYKPIVSGENQTLSWVWVNGNPDTSLTYGDLKGADGADGANGVDGAKGADGHSVSVTKTVQGKTTTLYFTNPDGTDVTVELTDGQLPPDVVVGNTHTIGADEQASVEGRWNDSHTELTLDFYIPKGADGAGTGDASWKLKVGSETEGYEVNETNNSVILKSVEGEGNLSIVRNDGEVSFAMSKTPSFDSVTIGSNSDTSKVVINDSGISMSNQKITGLAQGTDEADAVNVGQLNSLKSAMQASDQHLVVNPNVTDGKYTVTNNSVTMKVQGKDANNQNVYTDIVIDNVASAQQVATNTTDIATNRTNINNILNGSAHSITTSTGTNGNYINLLKANGTVDSSIKVTGSGGVGSNRVITFGVGEDAFSIDAGSVVEVVDTVDGVLTAVKINGNPYSLIHSGNLANANNLSVSGGDGTSTNANEKHGWTLFDKAQSGITYVDTMLVEGEAVTSAVTDSGRTYTIYDTAGNAVVLEDVASAKQVAENMTDIATNASNITALSGRVSVNEGNITTNKNNIATNASNITALSDRVTVNEGNISTNTSNITALSSRVSVNEEKLSLHHTNIVQNANDIKALGGRVSVNESNIATNTSNIIALDTRVTNNYNNSIKSIDVVSTNIGGTIGLSRNGDDVGNVPGTLTITRSGGSDGDHVNVTITNDGNASGISLTTGTIVTANKHPNEGELLHSISVNGVQYKLPSYNQYGQMMSDLRLKEGGTPLQGYTNDPNDNREGYIVNQQGIVNLVVTDDNGVEADDVNVYIANVARSSDLGDVSSIKSDGNGNVGALSTVSNHINNLYKQVTAEAAKNTIVTTSDANIIVEPPNESKPATYDVSLSKDISLESVNASEQIKVGGGITLSADGGVVTAHAINSDSTTSNLFKSGTTKMYNGYVSGLANINYNPNEEYTGGYAATQEQLQEAVGYVNNNITKLKDNDIAEVRLSSNGNGGTVSLLRNVITDGEHAVVPGTLSFASSGGVNSNKVITISSNGEAITLDAGSVVSANEGKAYVENQVQALEDITINGRKYSVATAASVEASKTVVQGSKDGVFSVTEVVANGAQHKTYNIDVNDMHVSGVQVTDGSNGKLNGTVAMKDGTTATITGLHDYYATGLNVVDNNGSKNLVLSLNNGSTVSMDLTKITADLGTMSSWSAIANGGEIVVENGDALEFAKGNDNIVVNVDNGKITVATASDVTFNSVDVGNVEISQTGINAGNKVITNVADGSISQGSTDAVNGSQLYAVNQRVTTNASDIDDLEVEVAKGWTSQVNGANVKNIKMGGAQNFVDGQNIDLTIGTGNSIVVSTEPDVSFTSVTVGNVVVNSAGIQAGSVQVNSTDNVITGLSNTTWNGTAVTGQSATEDQLKVATENAVEYDAGSNKTKVTLEGSGGTTITNVKAGAVSASSTDAVNGSQLWNAMQQDIKKIVVTPNSGANATGGTVALWRNSTTGTTDTVPGTLTFTSGGGTEATGDTYVHISGEGVNGNVQGILLHTGTKVEANSKAADDSTMTQLTLLTVNGKDYFIPEMDVDQNGNAVFQDYHVTNGSDTLYTYEDSDNTTVAVKGYSVDNENGVVELHVHDRHQNTGSHEGVVRIGNLASKEIQEELQADSIKNIVVGINGTIGLNRVGTNGIAEPVDGTVTVTAIEGSSTGDAQLKFSNTIEGTEKAFAVNVGSTVRANSGVANSSTTYLDKLSVNGTPYKVFTPSDINASFVAGVNNLKVENGVVNNATGTTHGWQVIDSNQNGVVYKDTTLVAGNALKQTSSDGVNTYEVKDTAGKIVTIDDVASASAVNQRFDNIEGNITNIQGDISNLTTDVTNIRGDISNLTTDVTNIRTDVNNLTTDITNIRTDISNLTTDVTNIRTDVNNLTTDVTNIRGDISNLTTDVTNIRTDISNLTTDVSNIRTDITNITGNQITSGSIAGYQYDAQTGGSSSITLVTESNSVDDIVIAGLRDTTLVANDNNEGVVDTVNPFGKAYTISDTNNNSVVLKDVASASKVSDLAGTVGAATKESLKESYKNTTYLQATKAEDGKEVATESLVEADVKLDKAIKDNADLSIQNDLTLQSMINNNAQYLDSRINQLGSKVNKVGAGAAALAALHPMDFDPDDKLSFAVGAGNYAGENATALGAFYRPNEKVMMSVGGTYGNGENMVNVGMSFALDRTNNVSNSRTAMAKEIVDLREQVATQGQQIAQLVALVQQLAGTTQPIVPAEQLFPDVPQNHWAYEYVNGLIAKGIIEGYPDGTFGGDRAMTRYEFAAMLFRAMEQGVVINEQVRQEFEKELGRVRVDRVKGADNDPNKIERVRVNTAIDRDDYGSKVVQVKH